MTKRILFVLAVVALAAGAIGASFLKNQDKAKFAERLKKYPRDGKWKSMAFRNHLDKVTQALSTREGQRGGPHGALEQKMAALAYPDKDIPLVRLRSAEHAVKTARKRGLPKGRGKNGWVSVGPSFAKVPDFEFRDTTVYTPNGYEAAGRTTTIAIAPKCTKANCRIWIGTAGGGVWRTKKGLSKNPNWEYLSGSFGINTTGILYLDPNDPTGNTIYAGTGEPNGSGDSVHGVGIYKSTNGGDTWSGPLGEAEFAGRAVGSIAIQPGNPNIIYAASGRGFHGVSSVSGGQISIVVPGAAMWGLYKSTDGGTTWTFIHNGGTSVAECTDAATVGTNTIANCSARGVRRIALDPVDPNIVYASSHGRGIWRSPDGGATWEQIKPPASTSTSNRAEFALTLLDDGKTRMYIAEGGGSVGSVYRADDVRSGTPTFANLTSSDPANPGYGSFDYCTSQCIYDNFIYTPAGHPDIVYLGGSFVYGENDPFNSDGVPFWISNGRGVVLSQDAGVSWTDMSYDATDFLYPTALHPDQHALVTNPNNPFQFFEVNDGGVYRSSGRLADISSQCDDRVQFDPDLTGAALDRCKQLLSAVPSEIKSINKGLTTLQFQSLSVNPFDFRDLLGGTQDNGTWESYGNPVKWINVNIGDGGQSGFDIGDPNFRFHTFFASQVFVNYRKADLGDWNWTADPFFIAGQGQSGSFYIPIINDPAVSGTMFAGINHVWRTKTNGRGSLSLETFRARCNLWTGTFDDICGDWETAGPNTLGSAVYGADRAGGFVAAVERTPSDQSTLWAATSTGRVFISTNANAEPASAVTFVRLDNLATNDPERYISGIFVDPADPNHAWISYSGFSAATPSEPGHVFSVNYDPNTGSATWTNLDGNLGDLPVNDIVVDTQTGDIYIAQDYGVLMDEAGGGNDWKIAARNMPNVEVAGLTIATSARRLYAATHGLGAWSLRLSN